MCGQEVVYLRAMLLGFGVAQDGPTIVWEDNAACIQISENPVNRKFTRHIDVRRYFCRDLVRDGILRLMKCAGTHNVANALTKSLPAPTFNTHRPWLIGTPEEYKAFSISMGVWLPGSGADATLV
mmetsp:Transcript_29662/g.60919  ORF Transcript_29662/g.60919 Transcript_29662/m.60919 type:complete len:125 (-) Transcript_29662:439-813(-)